MERNFIYQRDGGDESIKLDIISNQQHISINYLQHNIGITTNPSQINNKKIFIIYEICL